MDFFSSLLRIPLKLALEGSIQLCATCIAVPASILYKSIAGHYRPVSYPDGPITARYRFIKNAYWGVFRHLIKRSITKTCLYNFDPLKPHFYIVKLGFTGVYVIFLISAQNIDCGYSLEPSRRGGSNEYPQSMFWAEIWKISEFFIWKFSFFSGKIFSIFEWACFRNGLRISFF